MTTAEAERQQALLAALLARGEAPPGGLLSSPARIERGLAAYRANADASAERALASSYPTVQALMGEESFAVLAQALWRAQPPRRGDLACFGEGLPAFIADSEQLADVPYLADTARLDWARAQAERAAEADTDLATLNLLAEVDAQQLRIVPMPGMAVVGSAHPIVSIWRAHQSGDQVEAHLLAAREAVAAGRAECALVWRAGWRAEVEVVDEPTARWMQALLRADDLASALSHAGEGFAFETWLTQAVQHGWVLRVCKV